MTALPSAASAAPSAASASGEPWQARWRGQATFTVLATSFGGGDSFLAAWSAWRSDPARPSTLHFIAIEPKPLDSRALAAIVRTATLAPLAAELVGAWPPPTANLHRLGFEGGAVQLWLAIGGSVETWLPQLVAEVDAFCLAGLESGAAQPRLFKAMARLAARGATVASPALAADLRRGLSSAGFEPISEANESRSGDTVRAVYAPRFVPRASARRANSPGRLQAEGPSAEVVVVGAGLAGCAVAAALAELGCHSAVVDRHRAIAEEASGNAAGLFHGVVHGADGAHARFYRAAALAARVEVAAAVAAGVAGSTAGLLRLEPGARDARAIAATIERLQLPASYVSACDIDAASALAGTALQSPGWFYPGGGWVAPRELCAWWLRQAGAHTRLRLGCQIASLRRSGACWQLLGADVSVQMTAGTVVLAHAGGELAVEGLPAWPVERSRGQLSSVDVAAGPGAVWPRLPVAGAGYVIPPIEGRVWFGASTQVGDSDASSRATDRARNLGRLRLLLRALSSEISAAASAGEPSDRVAFRYGAADRLPIIGAVADAAALFAGAGIDRVHRAPRLPGLYVVAALGSRGIAAAAVGGRVVAAAITGSPAPLEADLLDAIDPARFLTRAVRRGRPNHSPAQDRAQPPVGFAAGSAGG